MVMWLGVGGAALLVLFAPQDALLRLFFADALQAELLRLVAAVMVGWSIIETRAVWRGLRNTATWRAVGWIGLGLLVFALLTSYPTALFFSFPLIVGATLSTAMLLAESWREAVMSRHQRRSR